MELEAKLQQGEMPLKVENYKLEADGLLIYKNIIYVPNVEDFKLAILHEMHNVPYVGHWISEECGSSQEPLLLARYEERDC
jgi:hypothetical protein